MAGPRVSLSGFDSHECGDYLAEVEDGRGTSSASERESYVFLICFSSFDLHHHWKVLQCVFLEVFIAELADCVEGFDVVHIGDSHNLKSDDCVEETSRTFEDFMDGDSRASRVGQVNIEFMRDSISALRVFFPESIESFLWHVNFRHELVREDGQAEINSFGGASHFVGYASDWDHLFRVT